MNAARNWLIPVLPERYVRRRVCCVAGVSMA
jgi:hypothetical protein